LDEEDEEEEEEEIKFRMRINKRSLMDRVGGGGG